MVAIRAVGTTLSTGVLVEQIGCSGRFLKNTRLRFRRCHARPANVTAAATAALVIVPRAPAVVAVPAARAARLPAVPAPMEVPRLTAQITARTAGGLGAALARVAVPRTGRRILAGLPAARAARLCRLGVRPGRAAAAGHNQINSFTRRHSRTATAARAIVSGVRIPGIPPVGPAPPCQGLAPLSAAADNDGQLLPRRDGNQPLGITARPAGPRPPPAARAPHREHDLVHIRRDRERLIAAGITENNMRDGFLGRGGHCPQSTAGPDQQRGALQFVPQRTAARSASASVL